MTAKSYHNFIQRLLPMKMGVLILLVSCSFNASSQEYNPPKNFIGLIGGAEWRTYSVAPGVDYEREIGKIKNISFGGKIFFIPFYKYGNAHLSFTGGGSGFHGEKGLHLLTLGTANFFPGNNSADKGFFINASIGPGLNVFRDVPNNNTTTTSFTGGFELGLGFLIPLGNKTSLKLSGGNMWGTFNGGFTYVKIAFGF